METREIKTSNDCVGTPADAELLAPASTNAAETAEGVVSELHPDYNVDDETSAAFIANKPEIPVLDYAPTDETTSYVNSYGNRISFKVGDRVLVIKDGKRIVYTRVSAAGYNTWVKDGGEQVVNLVNIDEIEKGKAYALSAEPNGLYAVETVSHAELLESLYSYGVKWDMTNPSPTCTRVGIADYTSIQSKMRTVILKPEDKGKVLGTMPKFIKTPGDNSTVVEKAGVYEITQAKGAQPAIIIENPQVGDHYQFIIDSGYSPSESIGLKITSNKPTDTGWTDIVRDIKGEFLVDMTVTEDMIADGKRLGIALWEGGKIRPFAIRPAVQKSEVAYYVDAKNPERKEAFCRLNLQNNNTCGAIGTQTIRHSATGIIAKDVKQNYPNSPQIAFKGLKVGEEVGVNVKVTMNTGTGVALVSAPAGFSHTADDLIIIAQSTPTNNTAELPVQFTVSEEHLANDRVVGLVLLGDTVSTATNLFEIEYVAQEKANYDGTDGDVMVELPEYYIKFNSLSDTAEPNMLSVRISSKFIPGYTKVPKCYVGAYHALWNRETNKLMSCVNRTPKYRGGDGSAIHDTWDDKPYSMLGKPYVGSFDNGFYKINIKNLPGKINWSTLTVRAWSTLHWFMVIEFGTFNYKLPFNAGGLGTGIIYTADTRTFFPDGNFWPAVPVGYTFGASSQSVAVNVDPAITQDGSGVMYVNSYRGVESPLSNIRTYVSNVYGWTSLQNNQIDYKYRLDPYDTQERNNKCDTPNSSITRLQQQYPGMFAVSLSGGTDNTFTCARTTIAFWSQAPTPSPLRVGASQVWASGASLASQGVNRYGSVVDPLSGFRLSFTLEP